MRNKVNLNTLQKCKSKENEMPEHREARLIKEPAAGSNHEVTTTIAAVATIYEAAATTVTAATIYEATTATESRYARAGSKHFRAARSEC
ncbi:6348_t:CDS:2 [Funneliformis caledonium]|uniref:6348_t:CDS:1 n=1 Tax=Funneliformis caledonium TaxID=1117310 RepID=A0A9N8WA97_9GLOM|nr:6348_t:CDS:2 [Funneliformis caledonium]